MKRLSLKATLLLLLALFVSAAHSSNRDSKAIREFKREVPCPATNKRRGPCPGWVIDHRIGLCVGGVDTIDNMRWMTVDAAKAKDRWECKRGWEMKLADCEINGRFFEAPVQK